MKRNIISACVVTFFIIGIFPLQGFADDLEVLERKLKERDRVILELLSRVEVLEKRLGVQANANRKSSGKSEKIVENHKPGTVVVTEEDAERALERSLSMSGAVLLTPGTMEVQPSLRFSRSEQSTSAVVPFDMNSFTGKSQRNINTWTTDLAFRIGLPWDSQLEIGIPYVSRNSEVVDSVGLVPLSVRDAKGQGAGDARIGLAKTLWQNEELLPDLVGRFTWNTNSGDASDNGISLGGGFNELQASLTATKRQDPLVFIGGLAYQYTLEENNIQPGALYSANFGSYVALSPETSINFAFSGGYQEETEVNSFALAGTDRTLASFVIGGSTLLGKGMLLDVSTSIGLTEDSEDFSIQLSLPIRIDEKLF